jgi:sugar/nucleoside kinase (ribokinase family)
VVGSVAQDEVVHLGEPLRAGGHFDARQRGLRLGGGAANTAIPLRHAGHEVALVASVGVDQVGDWLLAELQAAGIDTSSIARAPGPSTRSLVLVDPAGERTIVNLHRCRGTGVAARLESLAADAVYVRSREPGLAEALLALAARALVVAHVPPHDPGSRPAHVLVGSESDLGASFLTDPWAAGLDVAGERLRLVVITRGGRGAEAFSASGTLAVPARPVGVVDSTGAGDVFAAGLVHALALGRGTREALETAAAWGAEAVARPGVPDAQTIRRLI